MYQLYLDNQTISEHEINQYIADIGRQEISEQNFANRMLAYLMRITNASKMAEEKLEMKADKGKLIYPIPIYDSNSSLKNSGMVIIRLLFTVFGSVIISFPSNL